MPPKKKSLAPTIDQFKEYGTGKTKWWVYCHRHNWEGQFNLEANARSVLIAHEIIYHGRPLTMSEWVRKNRYRISNVHHH